MRFISSGTVIALLFVLLTAVFADTIYMSDESTIKGLVVEAHCDRIVFSTPEGEKTIFKKDIDEIFFDELEQNYYYLANRLLSEGDFEKAEKFYTKALEVDSEYKVAQDGLSRLNDIRAKEIKKWKAKDLPQTLKNQIGISILEMDDFCRVSKVYDKSVGLLYIGDAITAVWDESTKFMNKEEVSKRITGIPDSSVKVTIQRKVVFSSVYVPWYLKIFGARRKEVLPLRMELEGLTVGKLTAGSLAAKAGLVTGDRIIAIDGISTRYMPLEEAYGFIHPETTMAVELTIGRDLSWVRGK